ncbi:MCE family protein [Mycolicibacterium thermoresistibile]
MKPFSERNPIILGATGVALGATVVTLALQYHNLPVIHATNSYSAEFTEASGLRTGAAVLVSGVEVGRVSSITLEASRVVVIDFDIDNDIRLGDRTEATIKTKSLMGAKTLEVTPRGSGQLTGPIPIDRTTPAYQLPDALGELSNTVHELDTDQLADALRVLSDTFADTPPELQIAVAGIARFSETLNERDAHLRGLLAKARGATTVLAERTDQVVSLIVDTNALLVELHRQSHALDHVAGNISKLARELSGLVSDQRAVLRPALDRVNGVLALVDNRKGQLQQSIKLLGGYLMSLGESVSSGPFFKAYLANLVPGQFIQPFVDAAFSDLGLDPNVLLPSELTDPPVGQPGTPPLPVPYPRTGQGGPPNMTLPDAITGKPGDPRYRYREPLPAPPPGGPPPGPPALPPAAVGSTVEEGNR